MHRQARLDAPGTLHHVMIREIKGKEIFRDTPDPKDFFTRFWQNQTFLNWLDIGAAVS